MERKVQNFKIGHTEISQNLHCELLHGRLTNCKFWIKVALFHRTPMLLIFRVSDVISDVAHTIYPNLHRLSVL